MLVCQLGRWRCMQQQQTASHQAYEVVNSSLRISLIWKAPSEREMLTNMFVPNVVSWTCPDSDLGIWSESERMNEHVSEQDVWCTRLTGHELQLQGSHGLNFPGEAMNMDESTPEVLHGKRWRWPCWQEGQSVPTFIPESDLSILPA